MTPEMWERLKPLFDAAIEKPEEERTSFMDTACGDDRELRDALEQLVSANRNSTNGVIFHFLIFMIFSPPLNPHSRKASWF